MPVKLKNFTHKLKQIFKDKKKITILMFIGILGIVLIGLSDVSSADNSSAKSGKGNEISVDEYIELLEKKTVKILSQVDGAGKSKIMITAETSREQDFAVNQEKSEDISDSAEQSRESRTEIVLIEGEGGDEALVTRVIEPKIRGVLVLCEGAGDPLVNEQITQAVKTVLGVSSNKICVLKLK